MTKRRRPILITGRNRTLKPTSPVGLVARIRISELTLIKPVQVDLAMPEADQPIYHSGEFEVDLARRELRARGAAVPIGARAFDIVEALVLSAGELVTKDQLMDRVWHGAIVGDNTLQVHISAVRKALGIDRGLLKTASGRGYRLVGSWSIRQPTALSASIAEEAELASARPLPGNLPAIFPELVGRSEAVQRLRDLLSAYRAVTLTGPGGIGKTALALEVARGQPGERWLVELASLSNPALIPSAVAAALGLKVAGSEIAAEPVARAIGEKTLLLVLDNCEHLIEAAAEMAETVLRLCPNATVLSTSREVLRIEGEHVYRVLPLDVPPPHQDAPTDLLSHTAVQLFLARTAAAAADFALDAGSLSSIAAICQRLDGIPLAIEFAAARAATLGPSQVAALLDDRFRLLTGGRRTALPRHQTLRSVLDWSYQLLAASERRLLRHLAVFPSGFTVDAAAAVMTGRLDPAAVTEGIANLVGKSLVALDKSGTGSRWYLLETIRAYALEKLAEHNEFDDAAHRQVAYFRDLLAGSTSGSGIRLSDDDWACRIRELDNIRAALDWAFSAAGDSALGTDLTAGYAPVWLHLSLMQECRERCERALRGLEPDTAQHARLQMWLQIDLAASLFDTMGSAKQARDLLTTALTNAEALGDLDAQAGALASLVANYIFQAELGMAREAAERLGQVALRIGDPAIGRMADRLLGTALVMLGRPREGQRLLEKFLATHPRTADQARPLWYPADHRASARAFLARALWLQGFLDRSYIEAQTSLGELQAGDHKLVLCRVLYFGMCRIAPSTGNFAVAEQSIGRLIDAARSLDAPLWQTAGRLLAGKLSIERGEFAQGVAELREALDTCRRTGWRMSHPEFTAALAAGLARIGQLDAALAVVNEGLEGTDRGEDGQDLYLAEALRTKGEILLERGSETTAAECFCKALAIARQQHALLWELRTAISFARMRVAQDRAADASELLAPVYHRFSEGYAAPDLRAARVILQALPK